MVFSFTRLFAGAGTALMALVARKTGFMGGVLLFSFLPPLPEFFFESILIKRIYPVRNSGLYRIYSLF